MNKQKHKSKPKAKKGKKKIFFYLALFLGLLVIAFSIYLILSAPLETKTLKVRFIAGKTVGFDLDREVLTFGRIIPGGSAVRGVNIDNNYNFSILIKAYASKNIADYIDINQEHLMLEPLEKKKIPVTVSLPANMSLGEYSGKMVFKIYKAKQ